MRHQWAKSKGEPLAMKTNRSMIWFGSLLEKKMLWMSVSLCRRLAIYCCHCRSISPYFATHFISLPAKAIRSEWKWQSTTYLRGNCLFCPMRGLPALQDRLLRSYWWHELEVALFREHLVPLDAVIRGKHNIDMHITDTDKTQVCEKKKHSLLYSWSSSRFSFT